MNPLILDVRTPSEFAEGHVQGARNLSVPRPPVTGHTAHALRERIRLAKLPRWRPIHVYCARGVRAGLAAEILRDLRYDAVNIGGVHKEPLPSMVRAGNLAWLGDAGPK